MTLKKPLKKISDDVALLNRPYAGQYRDENDVPVLGVYIRQNKYTEDKLYINNGNLMAKYKYPRIEREFFSPMVNDYNLHLCGGWQWPNVEDYECLTRVVDGRKPMGFLSTRKYGVFRNWLSYCIENELPYVEEEEKERYEIGMCVPGTFDENFNIDILLKDYFSYTREAHHTIYEVIEDLFLYLVHEQIEIHQYLTSDYGNPDTIEELIVTGLILGYPIETTISILRRS